MYKLSSLPILMIQASKKNKEEQMKWKTLKQMTMKLSRVNAVDCCSLHHCTRKSIYRVEYLANSAHRKASGSFSIVAFKKKLLIDSILFC